MIKAIVFDFDGVIVDSEKIWLASKIKTLKDLKLKLPKNKNIKQFYGVNSKIFFERNIGKDYYKKLQKKIKKYYKSNIEKSKTKFPKLNNEIYKIIKLKKFNKFIVSNNSKNYIVRILKHYKIFKYFKYANIISLRHPSNQKPNPFGYIQILKKYKTTEVLIIEDSDTGITAARLAKIKNIYKFIKKKEPRKYKFYKTFSKAITILNFIKENEPYY